jgi:tetratricopeptide (TPR) repeat protein
MRPLPSAALCALTLALVASCSTAPAKSDTVITMKTQASQDIATGEGYFRQGRFELALQFFTQALSEYTSVDDAPGIIRASNAIGNTYVAVGSLDTAERIFLGAREQARSSDASLLFTTTLNLGELYLARGDAQKALQVFQEAVALPEGSRTPAQDALLAHDLGTAWKNLGDSEKALQFFAESLKINLAGSLLQEAASDYYMIASVHSRDGRYEEALKSAQAALALDKQIESSTAIAKDLYALGLIAVKQGDQAAAYDYFQRSYLVYTTLGFLAERRKALTGLVAAADALGRSSDADAWRTLLADLGNP